jgi:ribonuclease T2
MSRIIPRMLAVAAAIALIAGIAVAQDRRQNTAGKFDFYLLSLSWSPSFCDAAGERGTPPQEQCGARPFSFVVHGLWPQYERGFPEYCVVPPPRLDRNIVNAMLDLMPARRLIYHEWDRHGVCSGLSARAYFETIRKARAVVKIPEAYIDIPRTLTVTPDEVEEQFVKVNPNLTRVGISVSCDNRRLQEVRFCMSKELGFRDCEEVNRRACRRDKIVMPPVRGGRRASADIP